MCEKWPVKFRLTMRLVWFFNLPQSCDRGQTALLSLRRKACWGFLHPKNPTASAGFEPAILGTRGQQANHSRTQHTHYGSSGRVISPPLRPPYLTKYNIHKSQTSINPAGTIPAFPANERPQTQALNCSATEINCECKTLTVAIICVQLSVHQRGLHVSYIRLVFRRLENNCKEQPPDFSVCPHKTARLLLETLSGNFVLLTL
jgi:hypothetical protein